MKRLFVLLAAAWIPAASTPAYAAEAPVKGRYPERPLRVVVPYSAGGSSDSVARIVGHRLTERLGQQVVIDNRTGAGTLIGTEIVAQSAPDGYTLLVATPPLAVNPALYPKVSYVLDRDFLAVTNMAGSSNLLVAHASIPAANAREFIALLKASPGKLTYGSSGVGGAGHLATALFLSMAQVDALHVPYKGGAPAIADLLGERLSFMPINPVEVLPHLKAGRLRVLAVGSARRVPLLPDVPTFIEEGYANYQATVWWGLVAPAGTPREIVAKLNAESVRALGEPAVKGKLSELGAVIEPGTPEQFAEFLTADIARWSSVIRTAGIRAD